MLIMYIVLASFQMYTPHDDLFWPAGSPLSDHL